MGKEHILIYLCWPDSEPRRLSVSRRIIDLRHCKKNLGRGFSRRVNKRSNLRASAQLALRLNAPLIPLHSFQELARLESELLGPMSEDAVQHDSSSFELSPRGAFDLSNLFGSAPNGGYASSEGHGGVPADVEAAVCKIQQLMYTSLTVRPHAFYRTACCNRVLWTGCVSAGQFFFFNIFFFKRVRMRAAPECDLPTVGPGGRPLRPLRKSMSPLLQSRLPFLCAREPPYFARRIPTTAGALTSGPGRCHRGSGGRCFAPAPACGKLVTDNLSIIQTGTSISPLLAALYGSLIFFF